MMRRRPSPVCVVCGRGPKSELRYSIFGNFYRCSDTKSCEMRKYGDVLGTGVAQCDSVTRKDGAEEPGEVSSQAKEGSRPPLREEQGTFSPQVSGSSPDSRSKHITSPNRTPFEERTKIVEWLLEEAEQLKSESERCHIEGVYNHPESLRLSKASRTLKIKAKAIEACEHWVPRGESE